jgi:hypothetical protein
MGSLKWTADQLQSYEARRAGQKPNSKTVQPAPKRKKYGNLEITADGKRWDSQREYTIWCELKLAQAAGRISGLTPKPAYRLDVMGHHIATYNPDFEYIENGEKVVCDVKQPHTITAVYKLKKKLMLAIYGINVKEVF